MKKRILPILFICLLLLVAMAACAPIASDNKDEKDEPHEHTGGTATCTRRATCEICGEQYGERGEHDYAEATCKSPEVCKICRNTRGEKTEHDFSLATCTNAATCHFCGIKGEEALGHDISEGVKFDSGYHWFNCARCGEKLNYAGHTGGTATCTSPAECVVCRFHYGNIAKHDYSYATCTEPQICKNCGAIGTEALGHAWKMEYSYDEQGHWRECYRCDEKYQEGPHSGGEATSTERAVCDICGQHYGEKIEITVDWATEALSPVDGGTVVLANRLITEWADSFDFRTTDTDKYWLEKDVFLPEIPLLKWSVGEGAKYYKVYLSKKADMTDAECYVTAYTEVSVPHLLVATNYYWCVDAVYSDFTVRSDVFRFVTARTTRTVDIEGVSNARDLGGYITIDGKQIKQGMIYRSAKLDDITELGKHTLVNILGVKTDLDLRGDKATQPVAELNHIATACPWYSTGSNHIWANDYNKSEFAKTIKVFADPDNYPIIFHCSLGRDRTGTLAMVLGGLLGLDENTLMMEYELSVFSYWGTNGGTKYNNGLRKHIHDTYLYIADNYGDADDSFSEKVEAFLLDIGVTAEEIASIKDIMLEEVA